MKRRLPLLVEKSLSELKSIRAQSADSFHREVFRHALDAGLKINCKSGCSNCCYHPVLLSVFEGILLYRWLRQHNRWTTTLQTALQNHAVKTRDLPFELWFLSGIACPLLDERTRKCTAYEGRPAICRMTYSVGNPEDCHPTRIADSGIVNKQVPLSVYHKEQTKLASPHSISTVLVPLSLALLVGSKVDSGEVSAEGVDFALLREYAQ